MLSFFRYHLCSPSGWDTTGIVVEVKPFDKYAVKMDGSGRLMDRNRRFMRLGRPYQATFHKGQTTGGAEGLVGDHLIEDMVEDPKETVGPRRSDQDRREPVHYRMCGMCDDPSRATLVFTK